MRALGFFIALLGWLMTVNGYTVEMVIMIAAGLAMVLRSLYLGRR